MALKIKAAVLFIVGLVAVVAALNFLLDNVRLMSRLPETRVEQARREALQKPFYEREHRIERQPRLESALSKEARKNLEMGQSMRLAANQAVQDTLQNSKQASLTSEAHENLKADLSMRQERAQEQEKLAGLAAERDKKAASQQLRGAQVGRTEEKSKVGTQVDPKNKYHVIPSVDGRLYTEWQVRLCYYWYKQMKERHPDSAMGGFTRLLHSGKRDNLMDEIPTVVVDSLPQGVDQGYPVLNRPYAFLQWVLKHMDNIPEDYIFMAEPDHIFVVPPPLWATSSRAAAYPFSYITPEQHVNLISRFNEKGADIKKMAPIGNSPVQIHKAQLRGIVENWYNLSMRFKSDPEADKAFGWILDMYAFSIASSQYEAGPIEYELHPELMAQPPFDPFLEIQGKPVCIVHLTYGMDYDITGRMVYGKHGDWHFDKRDFSRGYPPRHFPPLPANINAPTVKYILDAMNEGFANIPYPAESIQAH